MVKEEPAFSPQPTMFSTPSKTEIVILATFNMSANTSTFDQSKTVSFVYVLTNKKTFNSTKKDYEVQGPCL